MKISVSPLHIWPIFRLKLEYIQWWNVQHIWGEFKDSLYMDDVKQNYALYHRFWNNPVWLI